MLCTGNELHTLYNYVDLRRAMLLRCIVGSCERLRDKQKGLYIYVYIYENEYKWWISPVRLAERPSKLTHGLFETDQRSDV